MKDQSSSVQETHEISLRLERYSDIFSDFDIRPYSKRSLSFDFLEEVKRAVSDKKVGEVGMMLYVPEKERKEYEEATIKERLAAHFKKHYDLLRAEKRHTKKLGITMISAGITFMVVATLIVFQDPSKSVFLSFLVVLLEPAGWFSFWEGLNQLLFDSKKVDPELNFYHKMTNAHKNIHFKAY